MKVDELRVLEVDELGVRLKSARRELYELRFKHAVGQLENTAEISKVRHDIARIMTVMRERDLGITFATDSQAGGGAVEETVRALEPAAVEEAPARPKRGSKKGASAAGEEKS